MLMALSKATDDRSNGPAETLTFAELTLNLANYRATLKDEVVDLNYHETELLRLLLQSPDRILPYDYLTSNLWGRTDRQSVRHLFVLIHRLRNKLQDSDSFVIETVRGRGYGLLTPRRTKAHE
jgi:two-component system response regulator MprA